MDHMVDISAIGAALSALTAAKDIGEAMIGLRDEAAFREKLIEFQSKLIDANNGVFAAQDERSALIERIRQLEQKVADFTAWESEKEKYELQNLGDPNYGVFAYASKPGIAEPAHWICPTCYERRQKSILQRETRMPGMVPVYVCHACGADLYQGVYRDPKHQSSPRLAKRAY
jgi:hypothetical protein